jgi:hypothetical protein
MLKSVTKKLNQELKKTYPKLIISIAVWLFGLLIGWAGSIGGEYRTHPERILALENNIEQIQIAEADLANIQHQLKTQNNWLERLDSYVIKIFEIISE